MLPIILAINDDNDRDFVKDIYTVYNKKLFYIANEYLHNVYDSEECVIDVFAILIKKLHFFQQLTELHQKNFLAKACRLLAINKYNKNKRRCPNETPIEDILPQEEMLLAQGENSLMDIVIGNDSRQRLIQLIEDMDPKYGDILYMKAFLDLKNDEISPIVGLTPSMVATRVFRARRMLLKRMEELGYVERRD